jgi:hypothetical protein
MSHEMICVVSSRPKYMRGPFLKVLRCSNHFIMQEVQELFEKFMLLLFISYYIVNIIKPM